MDADDRLNSSPASPPPRISVTIAAAPPENNCLTLTAIPISPPPAKSGGGGGREDCWSQESTGVLIDAWGERYLELNRGNLKQKHWKEVADTVGSYDSFSKNPKTDVQCKNRIDTVKKKYKSEKAKLAAGGGRSKWPFYVKIDELIGSRAKISSTTIKPEPETRSIFNGVPVGMRSLRQLQTHDKQFKRRAAAPVLSDSEMTPDSFDSLPREKSYQVKRPRGTIMISLGGKDKDKEKDNKLPDWEKSMRELNRAMLKFGEAYERAESLKIQQLVEMEKQRIKFTRELELKRMQFFVETQLDLKFGKTWE